MTRCKNLLLFLALGGIFMLAQACDRPSGHPVEKTEHQDAINVDVQNGIPEPPPIDSLPPIAEPGIPPLGGPTPDNIPGNGPGYGGGSQGSLPPIGTDNEGEDDDGGDEDEEEFPEGFCGNGVQEVLPSTNGCQPGGIYGATINEDKTSTLVTINKNTGKGSPVGRITNIYRVSAIDFSPDGRLYGVGFLDAEEDDDNEFFEIDCLTAEGTLIGPTEIQNATGDFAPHDADDLTDMDFGSDGELWAFVEDQRVVGTLNIFNGLFSQLTPANTHIDGNDNDDGDGLGFFPFHNQILYNAGDQNVVLIDEMDGT
ncbi:MAG: hypothetical protein ACREGC_01860, partial [Minisyncoccia bacterium]